MVENWRKPYSNEKDLMLRYFKAQHTIVHWFFTIWISISYLAIGGWTISYIMEYYKTGFDLMITIMMPIAFVIVYLFFIKLGHKLRDEWSCRELNALKKDTAIICKAKVVNKRQSFAGRSNGGKAKYHYYVLVNIEWQGISQAIEVLTSSYHYHNIDIGDIVYIFNIDHNNQHICYLSAYSEQWLTDTNLGE